MRILYINHARFPTEKAHGLQIAQVCAALDRLGHQVTMVTPSFHNPLQQDPHAYFGLPASVTIERLPHAQFMGIRWIPEPIAFPLSLWMYGRAVRRFLGEHPADIVYLRSVFLLPTALRSGMRVVLELHKLPGRFRIFFVRWCNRCARVVCLTHPMRDALLNLGVRSEQAIVQGDGVDLQRFSAAGSHNDWRLPSDRPVIGYVGSLVTRDTVEKGVRELIEAFTLLRARSIAFLGWIVGGPQEWVDTYQALARMRGLDGYVRFEGAIPMQRVPSALAACSLCVYPAPPTADPYFLRDTSPLKLFEYLAAGKPVVAADLPPLHDVVDERSVRLCVPGDPASLADAIQDVLAHPTVAQERATYAAALVRRYSWDERMKRILDTIR